MTDSGVPSPASVEAQGAPALARLPTVLHPHRNLLTYYALSALMAGPAFPFLLLQRFFKFRTLRYELDAEGITMRWGILFRREVSLTYARIQDIHLSSNVLERWLGLAKVQIQTASGSSKAEITIEGFQAFEAMRDFLYSKMRGARDLVSPATRDGARSLSEAEVAELTSTLREVAAEVRALRLSLGAGAPAEKKHG